MNRGSIFGNWRAQVVDNKDRRKFGRILVWIPGIMPEISRSKGIWARPANNPIGGRNLESDSSHHYMGTSLIPKKGSWVFVFFEGGNINLPYYFGALDLENTPVLPENQVGTNYENKWTLFKSHEGRAVVISDDDDDARTEITGKKREMTSPPTGDTKSVYTIDGNQTTILFDERSGKEKILIRTYKGDFLHIDIDERKLQAEFESDIVIKTNGKFQLTAKDDIDVLSSAGDIKVTATAGSIDHKAGAEVNQESGSDTNIKSGSNMNYQAASEINGLAGCNINMDGANIYEQSGASKSAKSSTDAPEADPKGERDT